MAAEKGLAGLAVTEHAPQMPGAAPLYYFQNFQVVPRSMCGIHLLLGAEVNITDRTGGLDLPEATNIEKPGSCDRQHAHALLFGRADH